MNHASAASHLSLTARWLAQHGAAGLILASRNGRSSVDGTSTEWAALQQTGVPVQIERCDVAERAHVSWLATAINNTRRVAWYHLGGVWHAAGAIADRLILEQSARTFVHVFGPKVHGIQVVRRISVDHSKFGLDVLMAFVTFVHVPVGAICS